MKKVNVTPKQEITAQQVNTISSYLEDAVSLILNNVITVSSGVITGLTVSQAGSGAISVSTGSVYVVNLFGELESPSGLVITPTASGTRIDTVVVSYQEVLDMPGIGWMLVNTATRQKQAQTFMTRKFGSIKVEVIQNTAASGVTGSYIPISQLTVGTTGITAVNNTVKKNIKLLKFNGENIYIDLVESLTIRQYIDDALNAFTSMSYAESSVNTSYQASYTEVNGSDTYVTTILYDPHGYPYKIKKQKNSDTPIIKKAVYDKFGNLVKVVNV